MMSDSTEPEFTISPASNSNNVKMMAKSDGMFERVTQSELYKLAFDSDSDIYHPDEAIIK